MTRAPGHNRSLYVASCYASPVQFVFLALRVHCKLLMQSLLGPGINLASRQAAFMINTQYGGARPGGGGGGGGWGGGGVGAVCYHLISFGEKMKKRGRETERP